MTEVLNLNQVSRVNPELQEWKTGLLPRGLCLACQLGVRGLPGGLLNHHSTTMQRLQPSTSPLILQNHKPTYEKYIILRQACS